MAKSKAAERPSGTAASTQNETLDEQFADFCLAKSTTEFADDLAKLRESKDFGRDSLSILVGALRQTSSMYTQEQKAQIMEEVGRSK